MRILIVKLSALGDVVQALAVLPVLRARWPEAEIYWLVEEAAADLVKDHPLLNGVFVSQRKHWLRNLRLGSWKQALALVHRLREESFDLVLDLQGLLKSAVWVALARARKKCGFANHREGSTWPLSHPLPPYEPERHAVWRYLDAAAYLTGQEISRVSFPLPPLPEGKAVCKRLGLPEDFVLFIPGARWETKRWPPAAWARLACLLKDSGSPEIFVVGGPGDRVLAQEIMAEGALVRSLCGKTSLLELAALLKRARLIITVDTGPMHLAAALGKKVVALFGPTAPWRTGPFGSGHRILRLGLSCSPCFRKTCPEPVCLLHLNPEQVFEEARTLWASGES